MAALPDYAWVDADGYSESITPSVAATEMERGISKLRLINKHSVYTFSATIWLAAVEDLDNFLDWYRNTIGIIGWFDMKHPRKPNTTLSVRFPKGEIGEITPVNSGTAYWQIECQMETLI